MARYARAIEAFLPEGGTGRTWITPSVLEQRKAIVNSPQRGGPVNWLVFTAIPNFSRAMENTARFQNWLNQGATVCALERYHRKNGRYPAGLSALVPEYLKELPPDVIGGELLIYKPGDNRFRLYSLGWNERDDQGTAVPHKTRPAALDFFQGDWVWPWPVP